MIWRGLLAFAFLVGVAAVPAVLLERDQARPAARSDQEPLPQVPGPTGTAPAEAAPVPTTAPSSRPTSRPTVAPKPTVAPRPEPTRTTRAPALPSAGAVKPGTTGRTGGYPGYGRPGFPGPGGYGPGGDGPGGYGPFGGYGRGGD